MKTAITLALFLLTTYTAEAQAELCKLPEITVVNEYTEELKELQRQVRIIDVAMKLGIEKAVIEAAMNKISARHKEIESKTKEYVRCFIEHSSTGE